MTHTPPFAIDPADTREAIMLATYRALCTHGYADLTIQRIGNEFSKSKSLLYHHYDSKDELLLDFLSFMLDSLDEQLPVHQSDGASDHLRAIVERMFAPTDEDGHGAFSRAMVELRAQAAHDDAYREHFTRSDQFFRKHIAHTIRSGIEQGVFQDVDANETAALLQTMFIGTMTQRVTGDEDALDATMTALNEYIDSQLLLD
ncbi:TetR family transcriptional regulator C-terminal domain-containing protein [Haladaptatus sp. DJG-WS-42]|uniref:TetR/AcrR family transcriptional regulator n=1 Tax=Haladaptatus sp. DJG-WS-42 TaxID=3120516 RepID=UPI0030CC35FA